MTGHFLENCIKDYEITQKMTNLNKNNIKKGNSCRVFHMRKLTAMPGVTYIIFTTTDKIKEKTITTAKNLIQ